jgi:nucleoside-diphosphate-sugar epimerase
MSCLIFGALSSVGAELVKLIVTTRQFTYVRAIDSGLLELAFLSQGYKDAFAQVDYQQANLTSPGIATYFLFTVVGVMADCFQQAHGAEFDVVFNCAATVKLDAVAAYYDSYILQRSVNIATEAAKRKIRVYVHESSASDYASRGNVESCVETDPLEVRTMLSEYRIRADEAVRAIPGLNLVLARCSFMYGPLDLGTMNTSMLSAYLMSRADTTIPIASNPDAVRSCLNTMDAAGAMLHLSTWYVQNNKTGVEVFNVSNAQDNGIP